MLFLFLISFLLAVLAARRHTGQLIPLVLRDLDTPDAAMTQVRARDVFWSGGLLFMAAMTIAVFSPFAAATGGAPAGFVVMVLLAPLFETLLLQLLPDVLLAGRSVNDRKLVMMTLLLLLHVLLSPGGWAIGLVVSPWLTAVYYGQRRYGQLTACTAALLVHMILNGSCWLIQFFL